MARWVAMPLAPELSRGNRKIGPIFKIGPISTWLLVAPTERGGHDRATTGGGDRLIGEAHEDGLVRAADDGGAALVAIEARGRATRRVQQIAVIGEGVSERVWAEAGIDGRAGDG